MGSVQTAYHVTLSVSDLHVEIDSH